MGLGLVSYISDPEYMTVWSFRRISPVVPQIQTIIQKLNLSSTHANANNDSRVTRPAPYSKYSSKSQAYKCSKPTCYLLSVHLGITLMILWYESFFTACQILHTKSPVIMTYPTCTLFTGISWVGKTLSISVLYIVNLTHGAGRTTVTRSVGRMCTCYFRTWHHVHTSDPSHLK